MCILVVALPTRWLIAKGQGSITGTVSGSRESGKRKLSAMDRRIERSQPGVQLHILGHGAPRRAGSGPHSTGIRGDPQGLHYGLDDIFRRQADVQSQCLIRIRRLESRQLVLQQSGVEKMTAAAAYPLVQ